MQRRGAARPRPGARAAAGRPRRDPPPRDTVGCDVVFVDNGGRDPAIMDTRAVPGAWAAGGVIPTGAIVAIADLDDPSPATLLANGFDAVQLLEIRGLPAGRFRVSVRLHPRLRPRGAGSVLDPLRPLSGATSSPRTTPPATRRPKGDTTRRSSPRSPSWSRSARRGASSRRSSAGRPCIPPATRSARGRSPTAATRPSTSRSSLRSISSTRSRRAGVSTTSTG